MAGNRDALLEARNLKTWFHTQGGVVKAVHGVSFTIAGGEALAVLGDRSAERRSPRSR